MITKIAHDQRRADQCCYACNDSTDKGSMHHLGSDLHMPHLEGFPDRCCQNDRFSHQKREAGGNIMMQAAKQSTCDRGAGA